MCMNEIGSLKRIKLKKSRKILITRGDLFLFLMVNYNLKTKQYVKEEIFNRARRNRVYF